MWRRKDEMKHRVGDIVNFGCFIPHWEWYQCCLILKDGTVYNWCRFIAKSENDAKKKISKMRGDKNIVKNLFYRALQLRYVARFEVSKVSPAILKKYDLNNVLDVDQLYRFARG